MNLFLFSLKSFFFPFIQNHILIKQLQSKLENYDKYLLKCVCVLLKLLLGKFDTNVEVIGGGMVDSSMGW